MKGLTITELAKKVESQQNEKRDFVLDSRMMHLDGEARVHVTTKDADNAFSGTDHFHRQVAEKVGVPQGYYQTMKARAPGLLATNVNHWLSVEPSKRMVRTIGDSARAFLSDRYRPMDNYDLLEAVLPVIGEPELGLSVISSEVTETKLYLKVVNSRLQAEVKKGDVVQAGIILSNSEVGAGTLRIDPFVYRLVCLNGAISQDHSMRKHHVGGVREEGVWEHFTDRTKSLTDQALWNQVRDLTRASIKDAVFHQIVDRMKDSARVGLRTDDIPEVIEVVRGQYSLTKEEGGGILRHLVEGGDLTVWGLGNAVTRMAQDVDSYDRAVQLEGIGGDIFEMPGKLMAGVAAG